MGLDNGVILKMNTIDARKAGCPFLECTFGDRDVDICYWRKCYGLRDLIFGELKLDDSNSYYSLTQDNINTLIDLLIFLVESEESWVNNAESIWEYDEYLPNMCQCILRLRWLKEYWKTHPDIKVYFYDSY